MRCQGQIRFTVPLRPAVFFRSDGNSRKAAANCFYAALMKKIHKRFVSKAHSLGLLNPEVNELSNNRKKVIILVADSTFLITPGSTRGEIDQQGNWHFTDDSLVFSGKGHHKHKYAMKTKKND